MDVLRSTDVRESYLGPSRERGSVQESGQAGDQNQFPSSGCESVKNIHYNIIIAT